MQTQKINGEWYVVDDQEGFVQEGATSRNLIWTEDIFEAQQFTEEQADQFIDDTFRLSTIIIL